MRENTIDSYDYWREYFMKIDTAWFGMLAKSAFTSLAEYYEKSESLLESAKKGNLTEINEEIKKMAKDSTMNDDQIEGEWSIMVQVHEATYNMLFPNFFKYSFIVLAHAILEDHLHRLCIAIHDAKGIAEAPQVPKQNIIKSYRKCINELGVSVQPHLWESMQDLQPIRNCIVHSSGDVSRSSHQSAISKIEAKNVGIQISRKPERDGMTPLYLQDNMIMVDSKYCSSLAHDMRTLIEAICKVANLPADIEFKDGSMKFI